VLPVDAPRKFRVKNAVSTLNMKMEQGFGIINGNDRQIAMRPGRIVAAATTAILGQTPGEVASQQEYTGGDRRAAVMAMTTLMETPRSPHDLWQEFQLAAGGRKAARLFSYSERGRSK
jgi:hypothetical protein